MPFGHHSTIRRVSRGHTGEGKHSGFIPYISFFFCRTFLVRYAVLVFVLESFEKGSAFQRTRKIFKGLDKSPKEAASPRQKLVPILRLDYHSLKLLSDRKLLLWTTCWA